MLYMYTQLSNIHHHQDFTSMASLSLCMVTVLVLLATPTVTFYRAAATITTVEIDNPGEPSWCGQKIESQRLSSCRKYLIDGSRFVPENYEGRGHGGSWREEFPRCCDELERINERCRCEAIQKVAGEQQETGELQGREMREMKLTAQSLPGLCRISPPYCDLENAFTF